MSQRLLSVLRVPGGFVPRLFLLCALLMTGVVAKGADMAPPKMLPAANTNAWSTSIITTAGSEPLDHDYSICQSGPSGARVELAAGAAALLRNPVACVNGFALLPAPKPRCASEVNALRRRRQNSLVDAEVSCIDPSAEAVLSFDDGVTTASFTVRPIGALYGDAPVIVGRPLVSDEKEIVVVAVFPRYESTPIYLELQDARSLMYLPVLEKFKASPPVAQHVLEAKGVFWIRVLLGYDDFYRCWPGTCEAWGNVYGFVANGTPIGGSMRVMAFGGVE